MSTPQLGVAALLATREAIAAALRTHGLVIPNTTLPIFTECELALTNAPAAHALVLRARVVCLVGNGIAVEFLDSPARVAAFLSDDGPQTSRFARDTSPQLAPAPIAPAPNARDMPAAAMQANAEPTAVTAGRDGAHPPFAQAPTVTAASRDPYAYLRNLAAAEQVRLAAKGDSVERIQLERLYGKGVWEALLRNPRITPPEVAKIARMGALPKPLLDVIASHPTWTGAPEVRRALLANARLAPEHCTRVLRLVPKHELRLMPQQTAYPPAVRDAARRLLREM